MDDAAARQLVGRLDAMLERADEAATELAGALVDLYGEGLRRVVAELPAGVGARLADDELVGHLLLLHDLHPLPPEERVRGALDEVRPYLDSHGGGVELLAVEGGVARLRLHGACDGCPSSAATLRLAIEDAVLAAAPEVQRVEADGAEPAGGSSPTLRVERSEPTARRAWTSARPPDLAVGEAAAAEIDGERLLFVRLGRRLYAYRPACRACGAEVEADALAGSRIACGACGERYDVRRAGRAVDGDAPLEPIPLLTGPDGTVKLALRAGAAA